MAETNIVGIVGAGAMGRGIAQIAAQAGLQVRLYDTSAQALAAARDSLSQTWDTLVKKGKISGEAAREALARVHACASIDELRDCDVVIEAIVERLDIKRDLFAKLEDIVGPNCILASNTSSLSITAIAAACRHPERVLGFHFFNPVPLMKVVEVVDGQRSNPALGDTLMALAQRMGHTAVRARDMPGFIVNHAGRGMSTEGLRIAQEAVVSYEQIDAIMREQAGFRMGPFELMDLTALDVSHPVMESIYRQFYDEPRFRPSPITAVRLAGGLLGRKAGEGFYRYSDGQKQTAGDPPVPVLDAGAALKVWVSPIHREGHARAHGLLNALRGKVPGLQLVEGSHAPDDALIVVTPFGEDVATAVYTQHLDPARTVGLDTLYAPGEAKRRTVMVSAATTPQWRDAAHALLASDGVSVSVIQDSPGFVAQRMVACIVNIACDIAQQQIATPADIDRAVTLGLGYPAGPLALGDKLGAPAMLEILRNMQRVTGDPRYRPSLWLQRRVQLGLSLTAPAQSGG